MLRGLLSYYAAITILLTVITGCLAAGPSRGFGIALPPGGSSGKSTDDPEIGVAADMTSGAWAGEKKAQIKFKRLRGKRSGKKH